MYTSHIYIYILYVVYLVYMYIHICIHHLVKNSKSFSHHLVIFLWVNRSPASQCEVFKPQALGGFCMQRLGGKNDHYDPLENPLYEGLRSILGCGKSNIFLIFIPYLGKIPILTNIFQMC